MYIKKAKPLQKFHHISVHISLDRIMTDFVSHSNKDEKIWGLYRIFSFSLFLSLSLLLSLSPSLSLPAAISGLLKQGEENEY